MIEDAKPYDGTTRPQTYREADRLRTLSRARFPQTFGHVRKAGNAGWFVRLGSYSDPRFREGVTIKTIADLDTVRPLTDDELQKASTPAPRRERASGPQETP